MSRVDLINERDIFLTAIEIADPIERTAYLEQVCAENAELRAQVEELLKTHEQTSQFLETPAVATDSLMEQTILTDSSDTSRLDQLTATWEKHLADGGSTDPWDPAVVALREELVTLQREYTGTDLGVETAQLMRRLPWPLDAFDRADIPEHELRAAGLGDAEAAPTPLVGIVGESAFGMWGGSGHAVPRGDGRTIVSLTGQGLLTEWDLEKREATRFVQLPGNKHGVLSPHGTLVAIEGESDSETIIFDVRTEREILRIPENPRGNCAFTVDDSLFVAGLRDGSILVWDLVENRQLHRLPTHPQKVDVVCLSGDGSRIASWGTGDGRIVVRNCQSGEVVSGRRRG